MKKNKSKKVSSKKSVNNKNNIIKSNVKIDSVFLILIFFILILIINIILLVIYNHNEKIKEQQENQNQIELMKYQEEKKKYQDIIFLGDSLTDFYDLEKYYDIPIINSGVSGWTTDDLLSNLDDKVFKYKAKKIILLIGTNDIIYGRSDEYIENNIEKIVNKIMNKNKYVKVYIESLYPINNTEDEKIDHNMVKNRTNDRIININSMLEKYCNKNKITYINMYDLLKDVEGNLKLEYTKEGLHISDKGYEVITNELEKYVKS